MRAKTRAKKGCKKGWRRLQTKAKRGLQTRKKRAAKEEKEGCKLRPKRAANYKEKEQKRAAKEAKKEAAKKKWKNAANYKRGQLTRAYGLVNDKSLKPKPCLTQKIRKFLLRKMNKSKDKTVKPVDLFKTLGSRKACNYRKFVLDSKRRRCSWARTSTWLDGRICKITLIDLPYKD